MKILSIISITFLIVFAAGCDEMQNQVMKPVMMSDDGAPPEDSTVTSVGTMKDPSTETDGTKEDASTETDDSEDGTSDEPETMEVDPPDEPQIPDAVFVSATPASGNIKENDSITITFDNDPGVVTVNTGSVSGSGTTRTITGPFPVGSLTLTISWPNGNGSHTLNYNVESPPVVPQIPDAALVSATPVSGDISENDSITITFDNDPGTVTVSSGTVSGSGNSWTISGPFSVGSLTLTISWTNGSGSHTLNYTVEAQIPAAVFVSATPASGNIKENDSITITFDNDPGTVTVSSGTVSGSGTTRTISGPFSVGSLTLMISWTNGSGSHTLNYTVEAQIPAAVFVSATPASGNIKENDSITITFDNDPGVVTVNTGSVSGSGNSWTISGPFSVGSLTLTISWTNGSGSHTLNYTVEAQIPAAVFVSATPASGNIKENDSITITFDNDPGTVTVSSGTVSGSGNSRTISGPFSVGSLTLTISWTNGSGSHTLNYTVEAQIPAAVFVSATPASGNIKENGSITITFDNDPGTVTVSSGTVSGSGNSRTISGPFSVGSLTLTISWPNGSGSHTLNYTVVADDTTNPEVTTSSTADGAKDVDPDTVTQNGITVTFSEPISSHTLKLYKGSSDVGWIAEISGNTITLTKSTGQDLEHGTEYKISGTVRDNSGNETDVSITFTTEDATEPEPLASGEGLRIGVIAPTFSLSDSDGNTFNLSDSIGSTNIVILFYRGWW